MSFCSSLRSLWHAHARSPVPTRGRRSARLQVEPLEARDCPSSLDFSTYLGGHGSDYPTSIAVDAAGNTYVAGFTTSTNFPTAHPFQPANAGGQDGFVARIVSAVPFATLHARAEPGRHAFAVRGIFTLGSSSTGIAPFAEEVTFTLGSFTWTIPAGSFHQSGNRFTYKGIVNGVELEAVLRPLAGNHGAFMLKGKRVHLTGLGHSASFSLVIGDDAGTTTVKTNGC